MKSQIRKAMIIGVIAIFAFNSNLYAGHGWHKEEKAEYCDKSEKCDKLTEELGLSPEQSEKLKAQREEFRARGKELKTQYMAKKKELRAELEKPEIDTARVDSILKEISALQEAKLKARVDKIIATKAILTPEQFKELNRKMEEMRCSMEKGMKKHGMKKRGIEKECR